MQSTEWHVSRMLGISFLLFAGTWLFLEFLFTALAIHLSASFIAILLFSHVFVAIIIYDIFRRLLTGKLTRNAIQTRFNKALAIAIISNSIILLVFYVGFKLTSVLLFSPVFLNVILFACLRASTPANIKEKFKLRWNTTPHYKPIIFNDTEQMMGDMSHPANPNGFFNPSSPNYIHRQQY